MGRKKALRYCELLFLLILDAFFTFFLRIGKQYMKYIAFLFDKTKTCYIFALG